MDASTIIAVAIIFMLIAIFGTVAFLLAYLGAFREILINVGKPPVKKFRGYYKFARGDYKESGSLFEETSKLAPDLRTFGIYYDDPEKTPFASRRYIVGTIVEEDGVPGVEDSEKLKQFEQALKEHGYKEVEIPSVENAAFVTFPWRTNFSIFIAVNRVYPAFSNFIKEKRLDHGPFLEVYDRPAEAIHFATPLEKFDDLYVLDCLEANNDEDYEDLSPESANEDAEAEDGESRDVPKDSE
ncbi:testis-expressed protein 264 homolog [Paramacrobiotus metropolitanus]|uniref:testis-expressed protein 264 homolog n=1 Tax=Paramacrobiotus metropolitanus TaxID=2943436 RepID=UPI00244637D4|nr:testis-expressed protein 264 homolog [Paramacrobiotus metropolitanus]